MPILSGNAVGYAPVQQQTTTAQDIVNCASLEVRSVIGTSAANDVAALIDWTNRVQLTLLRASRWLFLLSDPYYFITQNEQTDYYIGAINQGPPTAVDTGLNLNNVDFVLRNSVKDISNNQVLEKTDNPPYASTLSTEDAQFRPGRPAEWRNDLNEPNIIQIYPAPDNENSYQPVPQTAYLQITPGGSLPSRTYMVLLSFVDSINNEGSVSEREAVIQIPAGFLVTVKSPWLDFNITASGVSYNQYNIYAVAIPDPNAAPFFAETETLQNVSPIALGTNWTEPTSGLTTTGPGIPMPTNVAITEMGGYIVTFRYFQQRQIVQNLTDVLQIPDVYKDVMCAGVAWYATQYLRLKDEAQYWNNIFQDGIRQMIRDRNLIPRENDYIAADINTLGIGNQTAYQDTFDIIR